MREMFRLLSKGGRMFVSHPYGSYLHNLPFHYNGGFTHAWFEKLAKDFSAEALYWNYRYEKQGQALQRSFLVDRCVQPIKS